MITSFVYNQLIVVQQKLPVVVKYFLFLTLVYINMGKYKICNTQNPVLISYDLYLIIDV